MRNNSIGNESKKYKTLCQVYWTDFKFKYSCAFQHREKLSDQTAETKKTHQKSGILVTEKRPDQIDTNIVNSNMEGSLLII